MNTEKPNEIKNPCITCGKDVKWGSNGCPVVDKGNESGVLLGSWKWMQHYKCMTKSDLSSNKIITNY